ncbi:MAG: PEGA domain-containing protein [Myxococcales bacterium]
MRLQWLVPGLIALALGVFSPRSARAEAESTFSTAVLGLESIDVPNSLTDELSEQLRQTVSGSRDMHLVSGKDLVEVKLVFSCTDEAAFCMAEAGKSLGAQKLIYGGVKRTNDDYTVWLKIFDVRRARIENGLTETLSRKNADPAGLKAASARWFAKLTGRTTSAGTVQITSNVAGAAVSLDGIPVGITREQGLSIADVAPGQHELTVSMAGQAPTKYPLVVVAGQSVPVFVGLNSSNLSPANGATGGLAGQAPDGARADGGDLRAAERDQGADDGRGAYRKGFWVTLGVGLLSVGGAVKYGLEVGDVNKQLDPYRRFPCMGNQLCDTKGAVRPALTPADRNSVNTLNDQGNHDQSLQWICVGVGSALGIASGYLFYKGYVDSDDGPAHRQARSGLRVFPTAGVSSTGIVAEFEF